MSNVITFPTSTATSMTQRDLAAAQEIVAKFPKWNVALDRTEEGDGYLALMPLGGDAILFERRNRGVHMVTGGYCMRSFDTVPEAVLAAVAG